MKNYVSTLVALIDSAAELVDMVPPAAEYEAYYPGGHPGGILGVTLT